MNPIRILLLASTSLVSIACAPWHGQPDARQLRQRAGFAWVDDTTDTFILHLERGTASARRADLLAFQLDRARERGLQILGEKNFTPKIEVFAVGSRERMDVLVGRAIDGIAFYRSNVIAIVAGDSVAASPVHEVFHVLAMNKWGVGPVWLSEGMGVDVAGSWQGRDVHVRARELRAESRLATLERLTHDFRDIDPRVAYPQAGSFVRYLRERYNPDALRALWRSQEQEFNRLVGIDLAAVDRLWREWLTR